jgi:hypothetical protein
MIAFIEPYANLSQVFARSRSPENRHSRSSAENMALTSDSLKSREARALATLSSSQASSRISRQITAAAKLDCDRPLMAAARPMAAFSFSEMRTVNTVDMALSSERLRIIQFHE